MQPTRTNPGRKNIYCCEVCRKHIVTFDSDDGVTPFLISCQATSGCPGKMKSSLYRVFDPEDLLLPSHEWYRPGVLEIVKPHLAEHVRRGGLILRARASAAKSTRVVRHKKRGTTYQVLGEGKMQSEDWVTDHGIEEGSRRVDGLKVTIYQAEDGGLWVRPSDEFGDGRFEEL